MYRSLSILTVLIIISIVPIVSAEVIRGESTVPDWVKNTAGWWASEQIDDSAFLQGIQYLIKEGIMIVEIPTEIDSEATEEVPGWVKNTAGWWAEDKIHDTTFVSGIEYLIGKGIVVVEQEVEEPVEEVVEIKDFYMEVNGGSCSYCLNWAYVGEKYYFQIETQDSQHGNYIDDVKINAKIISQGGELRHDFGELIIEDGVYRNNIIIPSMDWYAENILSVTGEYFGVEKTIEKEFEVYGQRVSVIGGSGGGNSSPSSGEASAGSCAHVSPVSIANEETTPQGLAFSKDGTKMYVTGMQDDEVNQYSLTGAYCIGTASLETVLGLNYFGMTPPHVGDPKEIMFSKDGTKMFILNAGGQDKLYEYTLSTAWEVATASFVQTLNLSSQDSNPHGMAFNKSGTKLYMAGYAGQRINQYTLSAAWDVSSASFVDSFSTADTLPSKSPTDVIFNNSGTKMYLVDGNDAVYEHKLSTPWEVATASYVHSFSYASEESLRASIWIDPSGKTMFVMGTSGDDINVYKLSVPWDVSSASFVP